MIAAITSGDLNWAALVIGTLCLIGAIFVDNSHRVTAEESVWLPQDRGIKVLYEREPYDWEQEEVNA